MDRKLLSLILLALSMTFFSCSGIQHKLYHTGLPEKKQCLPVFPDKDGWYGGDGAYSIALDKERTLWLFGDTFVSEEKGRRDRIGMDVVLGTTLAISTCSNNDQFDIKYYIKKKNGEFVSSFGENEWLWPQDPFIVKDTLYIPLMVVEALSKEYAPFNFTIIGHRIAMIKDFTADSPHEWQIDYRDVTKSIPPEITSLAATAIVHRDYVYFYPLCKFTAGDAVFPGNILARVPAIGINDKTWNIEYFNKDGKWAKNLDARRVKIMFADALSELSVRYRPNEDKWIAVYISTKDKGNKLLYQKSSKPEGTWTKPKVLYAPIPEVDEQSPLYDKNTFCYAGKEHIQFAREKNIVATYVCNSLAEDDEDSFIRRNLFLYRPVVINTSY
ncbi:MAG TPA: DUF4185 domain-containing protein [Deltaproteobacteria bacterium]|nr:DUF4185 domain-containing protein [Deltaproteobacteria bacterium]